MAPEVWKNVCRTCFFVARRLCAMPGVIGIELLRGVEAAEDSQIVVTGAGALRPVRYEVRGEHARKR